MRHGRRGGELRRRGTGWGGSCGGWLPDDEGERPHVAPPPHLPYNGGDRGRSWPWDGGESHELFRRQGHLHLVGGRPDPRLLQAVEVPGHDPAADGPAS